MKEAEKIISLMKKLGNIVKIGKYIYAKNLYMYIQWLTLIRFLIQDYFNQMRRYPSGYKGAVLKTARSAIPAPGFESQSPRHAGLV